jgi:hypothetical protein
MRRCNAPRNGDASELGQLGIGRRDPFLLGAEVDEDSDLVLDPDDHAEPIPVMRHLIMQVVVLDVPDWLRDVVERTSGEIAPSGGASCLHGIPVWPP